MSMKESMVECVFNFIHLSSGSHRWGLPTYSFSITFSKTIFVMTFLLVSLLLDLFFTDPLHILPYQPLGLDSCLCVFLTVSFLPISFPSLLTSSSPLTQFPIQTAFTPDSHFSFNYIASPAELQHFFPFLISKFFTPHTFSSLFFPPFF